MKQEQAISATVTGNDQQVGFRAMVMKQAIQYNLAGGGAWARFGVAALPEFANLPAKQLKCLGH